MKRFFRFAIFSGVGWLCDLSTFALLVGMVGAPAFWANLASSYVGVTFVWFTSLNAIFRVTGGGRSRYLFIYWVFQFFSIILYSKLLALINVELGLHAALLAHGMGNTSLIAKIIVTPINLITNFLFMSSLTRRMHEWTHAK